MGPGLSGGFMTLSGMAQNFLPCDRDQVMLLPPDMAEWLRPDHLARFVIELVEQLDLSELYGYYRTDGHGRPAHDPAMMTALVLYNYAVGVTSSRAIERRCEVDVACRVITANRLPDHATIARFLVRHREVLQGLFFQVLALCRRAGMVRVGTVAVDSTKLAANASADQNRTLEGLREEARRIIEQAIATDEREDELYGERRGDELPDELADPRTRAGRIRELLEQAEATADAVQAELDAANQVEAEVQAGTRKRAVGAPRKTEVTYRQRKRLERKYNMTDPDSHVVRHRGMLMQGYNVQTVVGEGQIILAIDAGDQPVDQGQLEPVIERLRGNLARLGIDEQPSEIVADAGYWDAKQIGALQQQDITVLIPPNKSNAPSRDRLQPAARQMLASLETEEGKQAYQQRQALVEPVFAQTKYIRGITRLLRRGKQAVQAEIDLIATTHNLLKLYRHSPTSA